MKIKHIAIIIIAVSLAFVKVTDKYASDHIGLKGNGDAYPHDDSLRGNQFALEEEMTRESQRLALYCQWVQDRKKPIERIDLKLANDMTVLEWDRVPGIGPSLAVAIVEYREANGPFDDLKDIGAVKGIGDKKLESILELAK